MGQCGLLRGSMNSNVLTEKICCQSPMSTREPIVFAQAFQIAAAAAAAAEGTSFGGGLLTFVFPTQF
jgi:hypothetical protein